MCYVGQTDRHLLYRFKEHRDRPQPVKQHFSSFNIRVREEDIVVIGSSNKSVSYLRALEALCIRELQPFINSQCKDDDLRNERCLYARFFRTRTKYGEESYKHFIILIICLLNKHPKQSKCFPNQLDKLLACPRGWINSAWWNNYLKKKYFIGSLRNCAGTVRIHLRTQ